MTTYQQRRLFTAQAAVKARQEWFVYNKLYEVTKSCTCFITKGLRTLSQLTMTMMIEDCIDHKPYYQVAYETYAADNSLK